MSYTSTPACVAWCVPLMLPFFIFLLFRFLTLNWMPPFLNVVPVAAATLEQSGRYCRRMPRRFGGISAWRCSHCCCGGALQLNHITACAPFFFYNLFWKSCNEGNTLEALTLVLHAFTLICLSFDIMVKISAISIIIYTLTPDTISSQLIADL